MYHLTKDELLKDLHRAYYDARRHKRNKWYQLKFEENYEAYLEELCEELWSGDYEPRPSSCFIIRDPKHREVFAADFRDRIVHHLYYNYVHEMLERTFIQDSYSCIRGRGTHYGIHRLENHIRKESQNYKEPCYVMKLDIRGYFMHIDRQKLLEITCRSIRRMAEHRIAKGTNERWKDRIDVDFVLYLTRITVLLNPLDGCRIIGSRSDWDGLPKDKSLFCSEKGKGLPIGNLTSQLFSNVYMNEFDQYMKRSLRCRHYGRYVDDAYVVSADKDWLKTLVPKVRDFLKSELKLTLHEGKLRFTDVRYGVEFLGAYLKPHRNYISNITLRRMRRKIRKLGADGLEFGDIGIAKQKLFSSLNSFLGVLGHYRTYNIKCQLFLSEPYFTKRGFFTPWLKTYRLL